MKPILLLLFLAVLVGCKEKYLAPEDIQPLVGTWRLEAEERGEDVKRWEPVAQNNSYSFTVRYDGVILAANGFQVCCAPKYLKMNQKLFAIEPKEKLPFNPECIAVSCLACDTWDMDLQGDTLIVNYCGSVRSRFVRM
ncbi:hypothetical protein [Runella sp.]|uniref:hypothetical protein n=1 Tax=Runella sp. TaxID=1960881 RepID=UPI003D0B152E